MVPGAVKRYSWLKSVSFRLHLFIVATIVVTLLLVSYLNSRVSVRLMDSEIEQSARRIAAHLAEDLSAGSVPLDPFAIQSGLRRHMEDESFVTRIDIYRLSGARLTRVVTTSATESQPLLADENSAIRDRRIVTIPIYRDRTRFLKVIVPFTDDAGGKGCVTLIASLKQSETLGRIHKRTGLFLIPGSVLLSMVLLHFLFTRLLIRRFDHLIKAMNAASRGDLKIRAPVERDDELGAIANHYNDMMHQIEQASQERDRLLREQQTFNAQLQQRVREAIREISAKNENLRQVNEDLLETQRRLTRAERAAVVGQMAATFAHEIGSPLSAISTHLELTLEDDTLPADTRRRLGLIQEQVNRITAFVEELLMESRGSMQARSPVQLNALLQQLLLFMDHHLAGRGVNVQTRFHPDLPEIEANPQQLQQVFLNLLNNACDAMPGGGTVIVETSIDGFHVVASVTDSGTGIAEEKQARIFEPFFSTKDLNRGTGLGLSIAAKIVRQHKGTIALQSAPGAGAKFTIRFPIPAQIGEPGHPASGGKEEPWPATGQF